MRVILERLPQTHAPWRTPVDGPPWHPVPFQLRSQNRKGGVCHPSATSIRRVASAACADAASERSALLAESSSSSASAMSVNEEHATSPADWLRERPFQWSLNDPARKLAVHLRNRQSDIEDAMDEQKVPATASLVRAALSRTRNRHHSTTSSGQSPDLFLAISCRLAETNSSDDDRDAWEPTVQNVERFVWDAAVLLMAAGARVEVMLAAHRTDIRRLDRSCAILDGDLPVDDALEDALFSCLLGLGPEPSSLTGSQLADIWDFAVQQVMGRLAVIQQLVIRSRGQRVPERMEALSDTANKLSNQYRVVLPFSWRRMSAPTERFSVIAHHAERAIQRAGARVCSDLIDGLTAWAWKTFDNQAKRLVAEEAKRKKREVSGSTAPSYEEGAASVDLADLDLPSPVDGMREQLMELIGLEKRLHVLLPALHAVAQLAEDSDEIEMVRLLLIVDRCHPGKPLTWIRRRWPAVANSEDYMWSFCRALWPAEVSWPIEGPAADRTRKFVSRMWNKFSLIVQRAADVEESER